jgi:hypothetical protein
LSRTQEHAVTKQPLTLDDLVRSLLDDLADRVADRLLARSSAVAVDGPLPKARAAKVLGVHVSTLDRAVRAGCPFVTFNGRRRFDVVAVRSWLQTHRVKGTDAPDPINVDKLVRRMGLKRAPRRS